MDAFEKLLKLNLKGKQDREIVHVLMTLCTQEKTFNKFYALLAERFCTFDYNFKFTFQFHFWDRFKLLPELPTYKISNLAQLLAHLLGTNVLSLTLLKVVDFTKQEHPLEISFFRQLFTRLMLRHGDNAIEQFQRLAGNQEMSDLKDGLLIFLAKGMKRLNLLTENESDLEQLQQILKRVRSILKHATPFL
jgi:nucleolar MIF4G domain-containing protein 1